MTRRRPAVPLAGLLLAAVAAGAAPPPEVAAVELPDQLGGSGSVAALRGEPVVAMVVTAKRLRNLKAWQRDLQERFEELRFLLIADVPAEPPVTYEQVRDKLNQRVPEEVPVLIDLDRRWASELELDTDRPNLLLFDSGGRLVARFFGRRDDALFAAVSARIEALAGG